MPSVDSIQRLSAEAPTATPESASPPAAAPTGGVPSQPRRRTWDVKYQAAIMVTDIAVILATLFFTQTIRFGLDSVKNVQESPTLSLLSGGLAAVWLLALWLNKSRDRRIIGIGATEYSRVISASALVFGLLAVVSYIGKLELARGFLILAFPVGLAGLLIGRFAWRRHLAALRRHGRCLMGAIVIGTQTDVGRVVAQLRAQTKAGYKAIGVALTDNPAMSLAEESLRTVPRIESEMVPELVRRSRTRAVMIAGELPGGRAQIRRLGWELENSRAELILVSQLTDVAGPRLHLRPVEGLPLVHVDLPQYSGVSHTLKRAFDVVLSAVALLVLAIPMAVLALAVKLNSPGPVIFRQERVGVRCSRFVMYKFRSMVSDAEARLAQLQANNEGKGLLFKMKEDPRITRVGAFMRRYSLDELPQFWNVLTGGMSLVGPRPPLPVEAEQYEDQVARRLLIKPGITGLWQVSGRSDLPWAESVRLDLYYVENWSLAGDIRILARTFKAVLQQDGAY
jgi:exopolysaccharide biosynthesis polyprenyl glycosylphosphotransferase